MEDKKNTYEEKKQAKKAEKEAQKRQAQKSGKSKVARNWIIVIVIIAIAVYGIYVWAGNQSPTGPDHSTAVEVMDDASHIPEDSPRPEYNSDPPTSGPHYARTAQSGFREEEILDEHIVHNLEHGDIWIAFHPDIDQEIKDQLQQFTDPKVIITPRSDNQVDIAVSAWGRQDIFDLEEVNGELPIERIEDFIKRYMYQGPEYVPGASGGV